MSNAEESVRRILGNLERCVQESSAAAGELRDELANLLHENERLRDQNEVLRSRIKEYAGVPRVQSALLYEESLKALREGNWEEALEYCSQLLRAHEEPSRGEAGTSSRPAPRQALDAADAETLINRSGVYLRLSSYENAALDAAAAVKTLSQRMGKALLHRAHALLHLGHRELARETVQTGLQFEPGNRKLEEALERINRRRSGPAPVPVPRPPMQNDSHDNLPRDDPQSSSGKRKFRVVDLSEDDDEEKDRDASDASPVLPLARRAAPETSRAAPSRRARDEPVHIVNGDTDEHDSIDSPGDAESTHTPSLLQHVRRVVQRRAELASDERPAQRPRLRSIHDVLRPS